METLTIIIYVLLIALLVVAIIIGIKIVGTLQKVDILLDDVNSKMKTLNGVFSVIDNINNKMSAVGDSVVGFVSGGVKRLFKNKKRKKYESEEE